MEILERVAERQKELFQLQEEILKQKRAEEIKALEGSRELFMKFLNDALPQRRGISNIVKNGILIVRLAGIPILDNYPWHVLSYDEKIEVLVDKKELEDKGYRHALWKCKRTNSETYCYFLVISTKKVYKSLKYRWWLETRSFFENSVC